MKKTKQPAELNPFAAALGQLKQCRADLAAEQSFAQQVTTDLVAKLQSVDLRDTKAVGELTVLQTQEALLPRRISILEERCAQAEGALDQLFQPAKSYVQRLGGEIKRAHIEIAAKAFLPHSESLWHARKQATVSKNAVAADVRVSTLLRAKDLKDIAQAAEELIEGTVAMIGEREALADQLGGDIPTWEALGLGDSTQPHAA